MRKLYKTRVDAQYARNAFRANVPARPRIMKWGSSFQPAVALTNDRDHTTLPLPGEALSQKAFSAKSHSLICHIGRILGGRDLVSFLEASASISLNRGPLQAAGVLFCHDPVITDVIEVGRLFLLSGAPEACF